MDLITYDLAKKAIASEGTSSGDAGILTKIQNIEINVEENSKQIEEVVNEVEQISTTIATDILPFLSNNTVSAIKIGERILKPEKSIRKKSCNYRSRRSSKSCCLCSKTTERQSLYF